MKGWKKVEILSVIPEIDVKNGMKSHEKVDTVISSRIKCAVVYHWCMCGFQQVLDHDSLSRNDLLGSVSFTTAELEKIAADYQVGVFFVFILI